MTDALIRLRLHTRDAALAPLDSLRRELLGEPSSPADRVAAFVRRALDAAHFVDHRFWLLAVADIIAAQPASLQIQLFERAARRIRAAYRVPHDRRQDAIVFLAESCPALQCT